MKFLSKKNIIDILNAFKSRFIKQSDWEQNDAEELDYVKNRTHYIGNSGETPWYNGNTTYPVGTTYFGASYEDRGKVGDLFEIHYTRDGVDYIETKEVQYKGVDCIIEVDAKLSINFYSEPQGDPGYYQQLVVTEEPVSDVIIYRVFLKRLDDTFIPLNISRTPTVDDLDYIVQDIEINK